MSPICTPCSRKYKTIKALRQHLRDSPTHAATYDCDKCDHAFDTEQALNQHIRDSPVHTATYGCDKCNRSFDTEKALSQHLRDSLKCSSSSRSFDIRPSLHDDVARLLEEDGLFFDFHEVDDIQTAVQEYDSHVMGRFVCNNANCFAKGWSSKKIAVTIRMYPGARYNARIYYQSCKICKNLACPVLNDTYAERVAYRLRKWSGIEMETPFYSIRSKGPHETELCEGCKEGRCRNGD